MIIDPAERFYLDLALFFLAVSFFVVLALREKRCRVSDDYRRAPTLYDALCRGKDRRAVRDRTRR